MECDAVRHYAMRACYKQYLKTLIDVDNMTYITTFEIQLKRIYYLVFFVSV